MPYKNQQKNFYSDTFYHVYARGLNKKNIFVDPDDYRYFLYLFKKYLTEGFFEKRVLNGVLTDFYPNTVHGLAEVQAYTLLPNHFHLILYNKEEMGMSSLFRRIMSVYSNYFNNKYSLQGSLIQGNYRSVPLLSSQHLKTAFLYVMLNPVKHGLSKRVKDYPYSSHKHYMNPDNSPEWLVVNRDLLEEIDIREVDKYYKEAESWEEAL